MRNSTAINESISESTIKKSRKKTFYRTVTVGSVAVEPLYSYFLWKSVCEAAEFAIAEFGVKINQTITNYVRFIAAPFVFANLLSDMTAVDPLKEADELTLQQKTEITETSKRALGIFLKLLAFLTSFSVGGTVDSIPIAEFAGYIRNVIAANFITFTGSTIVIMLGIVYFMMFTNERIQRHANEFIDTLKSPKIFFKNFIKNPGKYLEVLIQTVFNSAYRGISFGYILNDFLLTLFKISSKNKFAYNSILTTSITTFIITLFAGTLSVRDKFLNPDFSLITIRELNRTNRLRATLIVDMLITLIRSAAISFLVLELSPFSTFWRYSASSLSGAFFTLHGGYVRYSAGRNKEALSHIATEELNRRRNAGKSNEHTSLLVQQKTEADRNKELFNQISANFNSKSMERAIDVVNLMARIARFVGFFLFIATIDEIFGLGLGTESLIALTFLWGAEVFKNNQAIFAQALKTNWTGVASKTYLEGIKEEREMKAQSDAHQPVHYSGTFFKAVKAVTKSQYDYPLEDLEEAAQRLLPPK